MSAKPRLEASDKQASSMNGPSNRLGCVLFAGVLAVTMCAGCTQTKTVEVEYTVEQTALVPAPTGPRARGPQLESGQVALEGSYQGNSVFSGDKSRYEGESGNVVVNHSLDGRFSVGAGPVEIGFDFEYMNRSWGEAVPTDVKPENVKNEHVARFGTQFRGFFIGDNARGFGGLFEMSIGALPYHRDVYEERWLTTWTYDDDPEWWKYPQAKRMFLGERSRSIDETLWYVFFKAGLYGSIEVFDGLTTQFGLLAQNYPSFFGTEVISQRCTQYENYPTTCTGGDPDDLDPTKTEFFGTAFASLSYTIEMFTIIGQIYGHPIASDYDLAAASPFGGDVGVRIAF